MGFFRKTRFIWEKPILSARADNVGFSQINCLYLRAQIIWVFPTSSARLLSFCLYQNMKMRLEKPILFARADKGSLSERNPHYLRAQFIWEKPTLSADNVGFFQKNLLYLRETHIIWSDNVSFSEKPTSSERNPHYLQIMWVFSEKPTLSERNPHYLIR